MPTNVGCSKRFFVMLNEFSFRNKRNKTLVPVIPGALTSKSKQVTRNTLVQL